ncbi:MAG: glycosyltransferase 87 family protein [Promethearchaeota archaeon]
MIKNLISTEGDFFKQKKPIKFLFILSLLMNVFVFLIHAIYSSFTISDFNKLNIVNDFYENFIPAVQRLLNDPKNLYISCEAPFRHLPAVLFYYMPFSLLPATNRFSLFIYSTITFAWNIGSVYLIFLLLKKNESNFLKRPKIIQNKWILMSLYLLTPFHWLEYYHGQTNVIAGFFILIGTYYYLNKKENMSMLFWSISLTFKILSIVQIIFFLPTKNMKNLIKRFLVILIGQIPNIILFMIYPFLVSSYINFNLSVSEKFINTFINSSANLARNMVMMNHDLPFLLLVAIFFMLIFPIHFLIANKDRKLTPLGKITLAYIITALVFPDLILIHVFIYLGILLVFLPVNSEYFDLKTKILIIIPTLFTIPWIFIHFVSIFYLIGLILFDIKFFKKNKDIIHNFYIKPLQVKRKEHD